MTSEGLQGDIVSVESGTVVISVRPRHAGGQGAGGPDAGGKDAGGQDAGGRGATAGPHRLAILLDHAYAGSVIVPPATRGRRTTVPFALPTHLVPTALDVLDAATGHSILAAPADLSEAFGLVVEQLTLQGHVVVGRFRTAMERDPVLAVALLAEGMPPLETFARRVEHAPARTRGKAAATGFVYAFEYALRRLCASTNPMP